jgi:hypothetical protein
MAASSKDLIVALGLDGNLIARLKSQLTDAGQ